MEASENEKSWQDVDGPPDCIQAVSDGIADTEIEPTEPVSEGEGDTIHVQSVQNEYKPDYWAIGI